MAPVSPEFALIPAVAGKEYARMRHRLRGIGLGRITGAMIGLSVALLLSADLMLAEINISGDYSTPPSSAIIFGILVVSGMVVGAKFGEVIGGWKADRTYPQEDLKFLPVCTLFCFLLGMFGPSAFVVIVAKWVAPRVFPEFGLPILLVGMAFIFPLLTLCLIIGDRLDRFFARRKRRKQIAGQPLNASPPT